jgi:hypothetical protein
MDAVEGPVGEDHAEPEGVVGTVAFEHGDLGRRVSAAHQRGENNPPGPPPATATRILRLTG